MDALVKMRADEFVAHHLFDTCPHVFASRNEFVAWKKDLSKNINVDAASITIVGSASIGVSLNPYKNFKIFDNSSDIDVAVISAYHFGIAWRFLREQNKVRLRATGVQKSSWQEHVNGLVYWGTIATDKLLPLLPFGKDWTAASMAASNHKSIDDKPVLFRLYNDYESLRSYQIRSVRTATDKIIGG